MKKYLLSIALLFAGLVASAQSFNTEASQINWTAYKVIGSSHTGTINIKEGEVEIKKGHIKGGNIVIDITSLNDTDLEGDWKAKLEGHLKSADFFDVEKFPTASFVVKNVKENGSKITLVGDMTIKDATKEVEIEATLNKVNGHYELEGKIEIDRTKFGLKYGSNSFFTGLGDNAISDNFDIEFKVITK